MTKTNKFIFWTPRILAILFIIFLAIFSLDVFDGNYGFWGTILGLFMHNLPVIILLIVLIISWKHELVGAIIFILAGALYISMISFSGIVNHQFERYMFSYSLIIAGPAFVVGILFLIGWSSKRKRRSKKR